MKAPSRAFKKLHTSFSLFYNLTISITPFFFLPSYLLKKMVASSVLGFPRIGMFNFKRIYPP